MHALTETYYELCLVNHEKYVALFKGTLRLAVGQWLLEMQAGRISSSRNSIPYTLKAQRACQLQPSKTNRNPALRFLSGQLQVSSIK